MRVAHYLIGSPVNDGVVLRLFIELGIEPERGFQWAIFPLFLEIGQFDWVFFGTDEDGTGAKAQLALGCVRREGHSLFRQGLKDEGFGWILNKTEPSRRWIDAVIYPSPLMAQACLSTRFIFLESKTSNHDI